MAENISERIEHIGTVIESKVWDAETSVFIEEKEGFWTVRIDRSSRLLVADFDVAGDAGRVTVIKDRDLITREWTPVRVRWMSGGGDLDAAARMAVALGDADRLAGIFHADAMARG